MPHTLTADALARVSAIGGYFAVSCGPRTDAEGFRPLTDLYGDPAALAEYVTSMGRRLGTDQRRVAASTLHIGTAARLWSIALGTAALTGRVPDLAPERLWWRAPASGPIDLWMPRTVRAANGDEVPDALQETVAAHNLVPLDGALQRHFGLSPQVMRGNATSALMGALRVLLAQAPNAPHPPLPFVTTLLRREPLASAGALTLSPLAYRRRSCCLYYRVPGGGYCGDCVLTRTDIRTDIRTDPGTAPRTDPHA
ncbi:(2Fe-2S)-binding protein [Streptomyces sp. NPDC020742]|uniref:(2Fe-2S)-binding protein n=1 Tax=Streptomyces sp. NPDC020742 TaxID=3154897 RepID=UPI0033C62E18